MQKNILAILAVLVVLSTSLWYLSASDTPTPSEELPEESVSTFSATQEWDNSVYAYIDLTLPFSEEEQNELRTPPPPDVTDELPLVHSFVAKRTPEVMTEIEYEHNDINVVRFNGTPLLELVADKPLTKELINEALSIVTTLAVQEKAFHDRIRPSYADPTLTTVVPVPGHPAYPSGHATQSHFIAYLLSHLDPDNTEAYFTDAKRISHNREIAGVHYPSDSASGTELAEKTFTLLLTKEPFSSALEEARKEW